MTEQHRIVVLGAGYAGLAAARRLAKKSRDTAITVVDTRAEFVERVRLHQEAAGQSIKRWDLRNLLERKGIEFIQARATDLDPVAKRIRLAPSLSHLEPTSPVSTGPRTGQGEAPGGDRAHGEDHIFGGRELGGDHGPGGDRTPGGERTLGGDRAPGGERALGGERTPGGVSGLGGGRSSDGDRTLGGGRGSGGPAVRSERDGGLPRELRYDTLVYALGSAAELGGVPGVAEYARSVATPEDVRALPAGPVVVVGAGATGIELAAELAEAQPGSPVTLVSANEPGAWLSQRAVDGIRDTLTRLGVDIRADAKVVEVLPDGVRLADGTVLPAVTTVWTAGFTVPDLARRAGLAVDDLGRIRTDPTLRSLSHPDIYAAGDAALMAGPGERELRMACATAIPAGGYVATAILTRARGNEPEPLNFRYYLQCISLGRRAAVIQFLRPDDTPGPRTLTGRPGALVKELIVRGAAISVGLR